MTTPGAIKRYVSGAWVKEGSFILAVPTAAQLPAAPTDDDVWAFTHDLHELYYSAGHAWVKFSAGGTGTIPDPFYRKVIAAAPTAVTLPAAQADGTIHVMGTGGILNWWDREVGSAPDANRIWGAYLQARSWRLWVPAKGDVFALDENGAISQPQPNGWYMGPSSPHPSYCHLSTWSQRAVAGAYALLQLNDGSITLVNASAQGGLRIGNADKLTWTAAGVSVPTIIGGFTTGGGCTIGGQLQTKNQRAAWDGWGGAQFLSFPDGGSRSGVTMYLPGNAPQMSQEAAWSRDGIAFNTTNPQAWAPVFGGVYSNASSRTIKRAIRSLRPSRQRRRPRLHPRSDKVERIDVMALRPVVYRKAKNQEPWNIVANDPDVEVDPRDQSTWHYEPEPPGSWRYTEYRRERLGMIAEEVQHVVPSAVQHGDDGRALGIDYSQITVALLDHVQHLTRTVEALQLRVAQLEGGTHEPVVDRPSRQRPRAATARRGVRAPRGAEQR